MKTNSTVISGRLLVLAVFANIILKPLLTVSPEKHEIVGEATLAAAYIFDALILLIVLLNGRYILKKAHPVLFAGALAAGAHLLSTIIFDSRYNSPLTSISYSLGTLLPFALLVVIVRFCRGYPSQFNRLAGLSCIFIVAIFLVSAAILDPYDNRGVPWWGIYMHGLHSTAYVFGAAVVYLAVICIRSQNLVSAVGLLSGGFLCLFLGWGVRSASFAVLILLIGILWRKMHMPSVFKAMVILSAFMSVILVLTLAVEPEDLSQVSSGRTVMYAAKVLQLLDNSALAWIIGNGAGSDLIESDIWWWAAKGAHSDVITFLVEGGIISLISIMYCCYWVFIRVDYHGKLIMVGLLFTSVISNGYLVRPEAAYLLCFALALCFVGRAKRGHINE
ncbi:hypothetical protein OAC12_03395 [Porticoccaceae bacterium]|nr:hypothetical protein [Porticoccaceae bacterium]